MRDSSYTYSVEAFVENRTISRSRKVKQSAWITVSTDGKGDFEVLQNAINFVSDEKTIFLKEGRHWKRTKDDSQGGANNDYRGTMGIRGLITLTQNATKKLKRIKIIGENRERTIIDGSKENAHNAIYIDEDFESLVIENITITNFKNHIADINGSWTGGKGIFIDFYSKAGLNNLVIRNCRFLNLATAVKLDVLSGERSIVIEDSFFSDNVQNIEIINFSKNESIKNRFEIRNNIFYDSFINMTGKYLTRQYGLSWEIEHNPPINFSISCFGNDFHNVSFQDSFVGICQ